MWVAPMRTCDAQVERRLMRGMWLVSAAYEPKVGDQVTTVSFPIHAGRPEGRGV